jgi:hypothetical protein
LEFYSSTLSSWVVDDDTTLLAEGFRLDFVMVISTPMGENLDFRW